jgi:ketopantoate reductase
MNSETPVAAASAGPTRVLVLSAGVIRSVYAGRLLRAGRHVVMLARSQRLADLRAHGLVLLDAQPGRRTQLPVQVVEAPRGGGRHDLVLVPVQAGQLAATIPVLAGMTDGSDGLFFGNTAGRSGPLTGALGTRILFGFRAVRGTRGGPVISYVQIRRQKTTLGKPDGATSAQVGRLQAVFRRRRVLAGPRGELRFANHSRAARDGMTSLAEELPDAAHRTRHPAPALDTPLSPTPNGRTAV